MSPLDQVVNACELLISSHRSDEDGRLCIACRTPMEYPCPTTYAAEAVVDAVAALRKAAADEFRAAMASGSLGHFD